MQIALNFGLLFGVKRQFPSQSHRCKREQSKMTVGLGARVTVMDINFNRLR